MKRISVLVIIIPAFVAAVACASATNEMVPAETVAKVMASSQIFKVTPINVAEVLKDIVQVNSKGPDKYGTYIFSGKDPARGVVWAVAEFVSDETGQNWPLLQIRIGFKSNDASGTKTYPSLHQVIKKRLGKPTWTREYKNQIGWTLGQDNGVILSEGKYNNPFGDGSTHLVVLEAAVFQGEPDG